MFLSDCYRQQLDLTMQNDKGEDLIPFAPENDDVVSTRLRAWNLKHPGNVFYATLLTEYAEKANEDALQFPDKECISRLHQYADRIFEIITKDLKGRFLKIRDLEKKPDFCYVMNRKQCQHKTMTALRNRQQALKKAEEAEKKGSGVPKNISTTPSSLKEKKKTTKKRKEGETNKKPNSKKRKLEKQPKPIYTAIPGDRVKVHPYALELINHVCNFESARSNNLILENPISKYATIQEPEKERRIRLQLRHRFFSAKAVKMPVVVFARKLLEDVWGGTLKKIEQSQSQTQSQSTESPESTKKKTKVGERSLFSSEVNCGNGATTADLPVVRKQEMDNSDNPQVPNPLQNAGANDDTKGPNVAQPSTTLSSTTTNVPNPLEPPGEKREEKTQPEINKQAATSSSSPIKEESPMPRPQVSERTPHNPRSGSFFDNVMRTVVNVTKGMMSADKSNDNKAAATSSKHESDNSQPKSLNGESVANNPPVKVTPKVDTNERQEDNSRQESNSAKNDNIQDDEGDKKESSTKEEVVDKAKSSEKGNGDDDDEDASVSDDEDDESVDESSLRSSDTVETEI